jgi:hypothetical protein
VHTADGVKMEAGKRKRAVSSLASSEPRSDWGRHV